MISSANSRKFPYFIGAAFVVIVMVSVSVSLIRGINQAKENSRSNEASDSAKATANGVKRPSRPSGSDFVGSQACSECHADIADLYRSHPMSRSMATLTNVPAPHEDYTDQTSFTVGSSTYRVERQGDRVWHHEVMKDQEGVIFDQAEEIQFVMGSGTRGRSYLLWRENGLLISPIAWYANKGWGLSPQKQSLRFSRRVNDECLQCHAGRFVEEEGQANLYPQPVFHEMSIGCERCHGPGKAHIEYRRSGKVDSLDPIVNPERLASVERDAVCYQCHFTGESRIARYGRHEDDFLPGQKMSDIWITFVKTTGVERSANSAASQATQMESSQCYLKSGGRLGCISCHDAHTVPERGEMDVYYRQKCLKCHADRGCSLDESQRLKESEKDSCIQCHMAPLATRGIPHVSQSDHRVLRSPQQSEHSPKEISIEAYLESGASVPPDEMLRARGLMLCRTASRTSDFQNLQLSVTYLKEWLRSAPDDEEALNALGWAHYVLGQRLEAESYWQRTLRHNPRNEQALTRLASISHDEKRFLEATGYFAKLVDVHGWSAPIRGQYANSLAQLGTNDKALEQANLSLQIDRANVPLYNWLSQFLAHLGKTQEAQNYQTLGRRIRKLEQQ